jgi:hypothetical protein
MVVGAGWGMFEPLGDTLAVRLHLLHPVVVALKGAYYLFLFECEGHEE